MLSPGVDLRPAPLDIMLPEKVGDLLRAHAVLFFEYGIRKDDPRHSCQLGRPSCGVEEIGDAGGAELRVWA